MFDEFWSLYPRKIAKANARKAWSKLSAEQQLMAAKPKKLSYNLYPMQLLGLMVNAMKMS